MINNEPRFYDDIANTCKPPPNNRWIEKGKTRGADLCDYESIKMYRESKKGILIRVVKRSMRLHAKSETTIRNAIIRGEKLLKYLIHKA